MLDREIEDLHDKTQGSLIISKVKLDRLEEVFMRFEIHRRFSQNFKSSLPVLLLTAKQKWVMNRGLSCEISWTMLDLCSLMNIMIILIRPEFDSTSMLVLEQRGFFASDFIGTLFYHACLSCVCWRGVGCWFMERWTITLMKKKRKEKEKKSDLWLIHYLLTKFPPPVFVTPPFSYTPAC